MKVICAKGLFDEVLFELVSNKLDDPVSVSAENYSEAKDALQRQLVVLIRSVLKSAYTVFLHSKYDYSSAYVKEHAERISECLKRINKRTPLKKAQSILEGISDSLDAILPQPTARTFQSQKRKVDLLGELLDFDFENLPNPEL